LQDKTKDDPINDHDDHMNNDVAVAKIDNLVTGGKQRHERIWHSSNGNETDTVFQERKEGMIIGGSEKVVDSSL